MTTKTNNAVNLPALYRIEYPNSQRGMFSLRAPFKNKNYTTEIPRQNFLTKSNSTYIHPEYLHADRTPPYSSDYAQRDAQVQCSLSNTDIRSTIAINRSQSPRYRVALQLQPVQPNIYEVWDVETPPLRRTRERSIHLRSPRLVEVKSLSDYDSDYDESILYARPMCRPAPCCHPHVRRVCVRQDANTICY